MNIFWLILFKKFISKSSFFVVVIFKIAFKFYTVKNKKISCFHDKYINGNNYVLQIFFYVFNRIVS